jgi:hypothetical protein
MDPVKLLSRLADEGEPIATSYTGSANDFATDVLGLIDRAIDSSLYNFWLDEIDFPHSHLIVVYRKAHGGADPQIGFQEFKKGLHRAMALLGAPELMPLK